MRQLLGRDQAWILGSSQSVYVVEDGDARLLCTTDSEVQAVATYQRFFAVAYGDKTLEIRSPEDRLVYRTEKRVTSLQFAHIRDELVVLAADLAGEVMACSCSTQKHRVLLGHTATSLTKLLVHKNRLFSADRDEKIRVSQFPATHVIDGYLLGHTAFVSDVAIVGEDRLVSVGGDRTIRLWDTDRMEQVQELVLPDLPTKVCVVDTSLALILSDHSNQIQVVEVSLNDGTLALKDSIECPSQPLGLVAEGDGSVLALVQQPDVVVRLRRTAGGWRDHKDEEALNQLRELAKNTKFPEHLLEQDEKGGLKLGKMSESRGGSTTKPWNRIDRVETSRNRNKRATKRRKLRKGK